MKVTKLIPIMVACFVLMEISSGLAQEPEGIVLTTNPAGATAYLYGQYEVVANTPARLPANITGRYKMRIVRPGYEQWKGEMTFMPGTAKAVNIDLSKKTRLKATARSLFIPGWGQHYSGSAFRGALLTTAALASGAAIYLADHQYQKKRSEYDIASAEYNNAVTFEEKQRLRAIRDARQSDAYQAETDRRTAFIVGAAVWGYNIIDAIIFFPSGDAFYPTVTSIEGGAMVGVAVKF